MIVTTKGSRRIRVVCAALAATALVSGCGQAGSVRPGLGARDTHVQPPRLGSAQVKIRGGTAAQRALLRRIVTDAQVTQISAIRISPPSTLWHPRPGDVQMIATLTSQGGPRHENLRGEWETWIIGGAFRDLSARHGLPRVLVVGQDGQGGSRVSPPNTHLPSRSPAGAAAFRQHALNTLRSSGAHIAYVTVSIPDGYAVAAALQTSRPAWFLQHRLSSVETRLFALKPDGWFLTVYGPGGNPIEAAGNGGRMSIGGGGVIDPRYQGCAGEGDAHIGVAPPPPCPTNWRPPPSTPRRPLTILGWEAGGPATSGNWNGPHGITMPYKPDATGAIGFALQNLNGTPVTVKAIHVGGGSSSAPIRYEGAKIQIPPSRTQPGTAGELHRPYRAEPPFSPFTIRPGDWVGVALHFAIAACTAPTAGRSFTIDQTFTITYQIKTKTIHHTYKSVPLHLTMPIACTN